MNALDRPNSRARYGRRRTSVDALVRTMLGEIADRLERNRPDETLTPIARLAILQATTMDPALSRALRERCPDLTGSITRRAYAAQLRQAADSTAPASAVPTASADPRPGTRAVSGRSCCGRPMRWDGGQYVCTKCDSWLDPEATG